MSAAEWKFQSRHNDRLLRRLEQPDERDGAGWVVFVCAALLFGVYACAWVSQ